MLLNKVTELQRTQPLIHSCLKYAFDKLFDNPPERVKDDILFLWPGAGRHFAEPDHEFTIWLNSREWSRDRQVGDMERLPPKLRSINSREYVFWVVEVNALDRAGQAGDEGIHYVTIIIHLSIPEGEQSYRYVESCAIADPDPDPTNNRLNLVFARLQRFFDEANFEPSPNSDWELKDLWIPLANTIQYSNDPDYVPDNWSTGLRCFHIVRQLVDRLTRLYTSRPQWHDNRLFWRPLDGWFNPDAVRAEMIGLVAQELNKKMGYNTRVAIEPIVNISLHGVDIPIQDLDPNSGDAHPNPMFVPGTYDQDAWPVIWERQLVDKPYRIATLDEIFGPAGDDDDDSEDDKGDGNDDKGDGNGDNGDGDGNNGDGNEDDDNNNDGDDDCPFTRTWEVTGSAISRNRGQPDRTKNTTDDTTDGGKVPDTVKIPGSGGTTGTGTIPSNPLLPPLLPSNNAGNMMVDGGRTVAGPDSDGSDDSSGGVRPIMLANPTIRTRGDGSGGGDGGGDGDGSQSTLPPGVGTTPAVTSNNTNGAMVDGNVNYVIVDGRKYNPRYPIPSRRNPLDGTVTPPLYRGQRPFDGSVTSRIDGNVDGFANGNDGGSDNSGSGDGFPSPFSHIDPRSSGTFIFYSAPSDDGNNNSNNSNNSNDNNDNNGNNGASAQVASASSLLRTRSPSSSSSKIRVRAPSPSDGGMRKRLKSDRYTDT